jgi:2',3'-cyclic-nucleotide 2'-phosphodiesterase (5'-nucleotidase family)
MHHLKPLYGLLLFLALSACQRVWQPAPQLQPQTSLSVSEAVTADATTEATIAPYREKLGKEMNEVIGFAPLTLERGLVESALGNFMVDLMLSQAELAQKQEIDLGLTTNGGIRTDIGQGNFTLMQAFELMPFENELVVATLPGAAVQQLFEFAAANAKAKQVANIAGATYTIRKGKPENIKINGQPFNPSQTYTIATSDYLANRGDNMEFFGQVLKIEKTGITVRQAIINHIKTLTTASKPIDAKIDGRVIFEE